MTTQPLDDALHGMIYRPAAPATVYIVHGSTGEYSDLSEWHVAAYRSQEQADEHARLLNERVAGAERLDWKAEGVFLEGVRRELDPLCSIDGLTGTTYTVAAMEVFDSVADFVTKLQSRPACA